MRQVILYPGEDGGWVAAVPSLPGCNSQGRTREEAIRNIREAAELWIETVQDAGRPIPADSMRAEITTISDVA